MSDIGQILPIEGYRVLLTGSLSSDYTTSLTHLYQPLIGIQAVSLYITLVNEQDLQMDSAQTHHTLMNYMDLPLDAIYRARRKLEGIGLLRTFRQQSAEHTTYLYELHPPFTPAQFFSDDMLTQLLYHHIGQDKFDMLKMYFEDSSTWEGTDITASFSDVFQTFQLHTDDVAITDAAHNTQDDTASSIDFSWIEQRLESQLIPVKKVLTTANKRLISQMMTLYGLAEYEVEKAVLWALTSDNTLNAQEFKEACHDVFETNHQQASIKLTEKQENTVNQTHSEETHSADKPTTKEEQLIRKMENISPSQLLADLSSGGQASGQDLKVIREVMATQGLPSPVMNVLIHYVLLQSDMKLSKAYMETIASHWSRANLQTAREAMHFAKRQQLQNQKKQPKQKNDRRQTSKEVIPDWFKERKKQSEQTQQQTVSTDEEWQETEALLRKYSKK
ncbi:DnaD domain protein [Barrientosiimonas marina]|uniref:Replication initiation and membrane attachment family protein n=1 Tax=Lentibacillus kimchii TaxID=1542911 RepID=A0ABW2USX0_9BACI